mmetsp:Transcript_58057/g.79117  ORF Transcript_58057/g.79117 Transcript_58057/m.79117 type:complete len:121 (-) Transcript_58057:87-449(-)
MDVPMFGTWNYLDASQPRQYIEGRGKGGHQRIHENDIGGTFCLGESRILAVVPVCDVPPPWVVWGNTHVEENHGLNGLYKEETGPVEVIYSLDGSSCHHGGPQTPAWRNQHLSLFRHMRV